MLHVLDAGSAPAVNRLVVVSDDEGRAALAGELLQPVVLDAVGILELVDEEVAEPVAVVVAELLYVAQEFEAPQQELRKIHDARLFAAFFVQLVEMDELLARRIVAIGEVLRAASVILAGVDEALHLAWNPALLIELLLADDLAHQALLVILVEDMERLRQARLPPVTAQHAMREAVEGSDPERIRRHAEKRLDPPAHLGRSLVRERDCHQAVRRDAVLDDQPGCTMREDAGFSAAGTGEDEHGPDRRRHGGALLVVQRLKEVLVGHGRADSKRRGRLHEGDGHLFPKYRWKGDRPLHEGARPLRFFWLTACFLSRTR